MGLPGTPACTAMHLPIGRPRAQQAMVEDWRHHYAAFPRLVFLLDRTGPASITARVNALHTSARFTEPHDLLSSIPVLVAASTDIPRSGPSTPLWQPIQEPAAATTGRTWSA
ncbi:hypothetical protein [Streptomyces sp. NPDC001286]